MKKIARSIFAISALLAAFILPGSVSAAPNADKPAIVLVHGAFADASGWSRVIEILQRDGYYVVAVQNPLESFAGDVKTTKRLIDGQTGPIVVVGHSYGGAVITEAAAGNPNVKALVYLAAFAPDAGEVIGALGEKYPTALDGALRPDAAGFLYVDRAQFRALFAADLSATEANVAAAAQKPIMGEAFGASVSNVAWKTVPSWYIVSQQDKALNPDLERLYAKRINATTTELKSSHVAFISHAREVARVIEQAAASTVQ